MARYDPHYNVPPAYWAGQNVLDLAKLLQQGIGTYHQFGQDEQAQQNNQRDYLLQLQKFLGGSEDKDLDRALKQQQLDALIGDRKAKAAQAGAERSSTGALLKALGDSIAVPAEPVTPMAPEGAAISPQAEDRSFAKFMLGSRKPSMLEAAQTLGPQANDLPKDFRDAILKDQGDAFGMGPMGVYSKKTGEITSAAPTKPEPVTAERTAALAASAQDKLQRGEPVSDEEKAALRTYKLKAETATQVSAAQGANAKLSDFMLAETPRPTIPPVGVASGITDRNPDAREGGALPVQRGSSVDIAAQRDLFGGQPAPTGPPGETVLERKTRLAGEAEQGVKQRAPVGKDAVSFVLKSTGLPPPPDMPLEQVQKQGVAVTPTQFAALSAARRGLTLLRGLEDPEMAKLFPENPVAAPGFLGNLVNSARGAMFAPEAQFRAKSDPRYGELVTRFSMAIPALAKATGEVGNLSEFEQQVVKDAMGIGRTRASYQAGIKAYREALERGFKANGIPIPEELRVEGSSGTTEPTGSTVSSQPEQRPVSPTPLPHPAQGGTPMNGRRVRVRRRSDGKPGTIDAEDFDPNTYERIP